MASVFGEVTDFKYLLTPLLDGQADQPPRIFAPIETCGEIHFPLASTHCRAVTFRLMKEAS
jgi:hypothetical protein